MRLIKIVILAFLFFVCGFAYANEEFEQTIKTKSLDLELLVGRPFSRKDHQLRICGFNSKGEAVGQSNFKNSSPDIGNEEIIAWYWHPEIGFKIIASGNEILKAYGKELTKPFQFYQMFINESGVVVCSFLIDKKGYNICPWLWWTKHEGLHLSDEPSSYQLITKFSDNGDILILEFLSHPSFRLHIKSLEENKDLYTYSFDLPSEITPYSTGFKLFPDLLEKKIVEMLFKYTNIRVKKINDFVWGPISIDEFAEDLNIKGRVSVRAKFFERINPIFWNIHIFFEINSSQAKFYVEKIIEEFQTYPRRFMDLDNELIFEKNL